MYYHPGIVLEVIFPKEKEVESSDNSVQAVVETWDENIITYLVDPRISDKIKAGDVVLIDYNPTSEQPFRPRQLIIKILHGEKGRKIWEAYKEYFKRRPKGRPIQVPIKHPEYIG